MLPAPAAEAPMLHRTVAAVIAGSALLLVLGCAGGLVALQRDLVRPPPINVQAGRFQVAAFIEVVSSNVRPTHAYYTIWVFGRMEPSAGTRAAGTLEWGRQVVGLEVAVPTPPARRDRQPRDDGVSQDAATEH
jgi:hypothetical protein